MECWTRALELSSRSNGKLNKMESIAILEQLADIAVVNHHELTIRSYRDLYAARMRLLGSDHPETLSMTIRLGSVLELTTTTKATWKKLWGFMKQCGAAG